MRTAFQTTSTRGLNHDLPPMRLYHKAKKLGTWDPRDIDLSQDMKDWKKLTPEEQGLILHLTALFQAGEEAVTLDLLPLIQVIAAQGRLEEEMFLTTFLFEEAKHVEVFRRFFDEIAQTNDDLTHYHTDNYRLIFYEELPKALNKLKDDSSPEALASASVTYNMIVEGMLAETGYHAYYSMLQRNGIFPGMVEITTRLKRDESRHIAYGVYLLSRLVAEHGDVVWNVIDQRMQTLFVPAMEVVNEIFAVYDDNPPFGLDKNDFVAFAMTQFQARMARIEKSRGQTLDEINRSADFDPGS